LRRIALSVQGYSRFDAHQTIAIMISIELRLMQ
jgi:hypothetical protein